MSVAFIVGDATYEIGSSSFLKSFFSTVYIRLENGAWGARFPVLMKTLYRGTLPGKDAAAALREVDMIAAEFAALTPSAIVWDFEDPAARPPWGDKLAPAITSVANFYVTSDGRDFFDVLRGALCRSRDSGTPVFIR